MVIHQRAGSGQHFARFSRSYWISRSMFEAVVERLEEGDVFDQRIKRIRCRGEDACSVGVAIEPVARWDRESCRRGNSDVSGWPMDGVARPMPVTSDVEATTVSFTKACTTRARLFLPVWRVLS
jgi:hypothetical protein